MNTPRVLEFFSHPWVAVRFLRGRQMSCWRGVCKRCASSHGTKLEVATRRASKRDGMDWHGIAVSSETIFTTNFPWISGICVAGPLRLGKGGGDRCLLHRLPGQLQEDAESHRCSSSKTLIRDTVNSGCMPGERLLFHIPGSLAI